MIALRCICANIWNLIWSHCIPLEFLYSTSISRRMMASSQASPEVLNLVALIKTLTNPQLKDLLRNEGLAVSGVKASLQMRIIDCSSPTLLSPPSPHFTLRFPLSIPSSACLRSWPPNILPFFFLFFSTERFWPLWFNQILKDLPTPTGMVCVMMRWSDAFINRQYPAQCHSNPTLGSNLPTHRMRLQYIRGLCHPTAQWLQARRLIVSPNQISRCRELRGSWLVASFYYIQRQSFLYCPISSYSGGRM